MYFPRGILCSLRCFSSFDCRLNKYAARESRMIQKLMKGSLHKKKNWYKTEKWGSFFPSPEKSSFHQGSKVTKRIAVLNKLFMKNITDLMATGEVASEILGQGISISRVQVTSDYKIVNVFWLAKGTEKDVAIEKILTDAAYSLRHELSQLHVMGVVPKIVFVKDKQTGIVAEVDRLLYKADFGDDFKPPDPASYLKSEFILSNPLEPQNQDVINKLPIEEDDEENEPLPPMRMDVLGLNHSEIMNRICKSVKKSEAVHRRIPTLSDKGLPEEKLITACDPKYQKTNIVKFIQKQRIVKEKKRRQDKKFQLERELLALHSNHDKISEDWNEEEDGDYIDETEDVHRS